jgi:hypothetical protein
MFSCFNRVVKLIYKKSKALQIAGCGSLQVCEMLRILHYLDNRLKDGSKFVSFTVLYFPEILFFYFWYSLLLKLVIY